MKLSKFFSSLLGLGSASSKQGQLEHVVPTGAAGNRPYLAFSDNTSWRAVTPVHEGVFANLPATNAVPTGALALVTDVYDVNGVAGAWFRNSGTVWKKLDEEFEVSVLDIASARVDNNSVITTQVQAALDKAYTSTAPSGFVYGKGRTIVSPPGVIRTGPLNMSTWTAIQTSGPQGSSVWKFSNAGVSSPTAMITSRFDADQQSSIGSQPYLAGLALEGDKSNSSTIVHGYWAPEMPSGEKDDAPFFLRTQISGFSGDGVHIDKGHNQIRGTGFKSIAHDGWSLWVDKSSDSKLSQVGFGRSLKGQVYLKNCASIKMAQFDIWTPGGGIFQGEWALYMLSCRNASFDQGELQGRIYIEGGNVTDSDQTRFQVVNTTFSSFNIKVSPETYQGTQYPGGGGTKTYDSMILNRGAFGVKYIGGAFGYSQGAATAEEITATPKYIWEFNVPAGRNYATEAGYVEVTNVDMIHMNPLPGVAAAQIPFTRHWASDPARVIFKGGTPPGQPVLLHDAAVTINMVPADGRTVTTDQYPLLWLGQDFTRNWSSGSRPATFTVPDMSGMVTGPGMGWYVALW